MTTEPTRRQQLRKKKKANLLVNSLIGIVGLLIVITLVNLLSNDSDEVAEENPPTEEVETDSPTESEEAQDTEETQDTEQDANDLTTEEVEEPNDTDSETDSTDTTEDVESEEEPTTDTTESQEITTQPSDDPIVDEVIVNNGWEPVGTTQTGNHVSSYDTSSTDWAEKVQALSYASGLAQDNMIIKFLGNGGSPQKSIGTITSSDQTEMYRVYLEWVDGQGWKPTKMDVLNRLP